MTQEELADLLGVGRTFVTRTVSKLREQGVIATRRGVFIVLDEPALRQLACGCTTAIEDHFDTVLHGILPGRLIEPHLAGEESVVPCAGVRSRPP